MACLTCDHRLACRVRSLAGPSGGTGGPALGWTLALLSMLQELEEPPAEESASMKRVRQARRHVLWRLAHPYDPQTAVRLIVWFPSSHRVVVTLVGFDKAKLGDVWYDSATIRAESMVDQWLREERSS